MHLYIHRYNVYNLRGRHRKNNDIEASRTTYIYM